MVPATTTVAEWTRSDDQLGQSQVRVATQSLAGSGWGRYVDRIRHSDLQSGSNSDDPCNAVGSGKRTHSSLQPPSGSYPICCSSRVCHGKLIIINYLAQSAPTSEAKG